MKIKDLREILNYCREKYKLPYVQLLLKDNKCSRAKRIYCGKTGRLKRQIILAKFWHKHCDEAVIADLLHEIAHHIHREKFDYMSHDHNFKIIERELLLDFGLVPKQYMKAYYRRLETVSGMCLWEM